MANLNIASVLAFALLAGCATESQPTQNAPKPPLEKKNIEATESVGFKAEKEINAAEAKLDALDPDGAVEHLDEANEHLKDPALENYPEAKLLHTRYDGLVARVPVVREEIRKRKLKAAVDEAKGKIDSAKAALDESVKQIKKKHPEESELTAAVEAVKKLQASLEESSKLESEDTGYAKYALAITKELANQKKLIQQRGLDVALDDSRQEIGKAVTQLGEALTRVKKKDVGEEDFKEAANAVEAVEGALKKGAPLFAKDAGYAKFAGQVKERLATQREGLSKRRHEVLVQRARARIDEARKALSESVAKLKGKDVPDASFENAGSASKELGKTLEEQKELSTNDAAFSQWVSDQKKSLATVNSTIEKRRTEVTIERQRVKVAEGLAAVKKAVGHMPTIDQADSADTAVSELEKMIEEGDKLGSKDGSYSKFAIEARKTVSESKRKIRERRDQIAMDAQKEKIGSQLQNLKGAMAGIGGFSPGEPEFNAATEAAQGARKAVDEGKELESKLPKYKSLAEAARKTIAAAEQKIAKRKLEIAVREHKMLIEQAFESAKSSVANAKKVSATSDQAKEAESAMNAARDEIAKGQELEGKDAKYAAMVAHAKKQLDGWKDDVEIAKYVAAFREGPIAAASQGLALMGSKSYGDAIDQFKTCRKDGASLIADHPKIAQATFVLGKKKTNARGVLTVCADYAKSAETKQAQADKKKNGKRR
jgi:hypothetical protein